MSVPLAAMMPKVDIGTDIAGHTLFR